MKKQEIERSAFLYTKNKNTGEIEDVVFSKNVQIGLKSERKNFHISGSKSISSTIFEYSQNASYFEVDNKTSIVLLKKTDSASNYDVNISLPKRKKEGYCLTIKETSGSLFSNTVKLLDSSGSIVSVITTQNSTIQLYWTGEKWEIFSYSSGVNSGQGENWVFVKTKWDLPAPVQGIYQLKDDTTYVFVETVDLDGGRIVSGQNTTLMGSSSESAKIKSTGLVGQALITSSHSLPMKNLSIEANIALNLNANTSPGAALNWYGVSFINCPNCGTISNYNNLIASDCSWVNSGNLTFDQNHTTIAFFQCIFSPASGTTSIIILPTAIIARRFRVIYSAFIILPGRTGINFSASASVPNENYILDTTTFSGGGTPTQGVSYEDNKSRWVNCSGVKNSISVVNMFVSGNSTATNFLVSTVKYFMISNPDFTNVSSIKQRFTYFPPVITPGIEAPPSVRYDGSATRVFKVQVSVSITGVQNNVYAIYIAKCPNGNSFDPSSDAIASSKILITGSGASKPESAFLQCLVELEQNDKVYIVMSDQSSDKNATVKYLNMIVEQAVS